MCDCAWSGVEKDRQLVEARRLLREELPEDNHTVLKYILDLLVEVRARFGCVFGSPEHSAHVELL